MTQAEIITIGTELLLGEIQDTNTRHLARQLRQLGIDLFRVSTIGDNPLRIADVIQESLSRAEIVITTGGLGPTIDDPTRNAAAIAFNVEMIFHADLWQEIYQRFQIRGIIPSDNNRKQAYLPANAGAIHNPVGTAPAFYIANQGKLLVCLPGVPAEMETIFQQSVIPLLREQYALHQIIKTRVIHTSGIGESVVDDLIADLETLSNPTVGLSAHPGCVDIRITTKAASSQEAEKMIHDVEQKIITRLPQHVYGYDEDTLLDKVLELASNKRISITLFTFRAQNEFINLFAQPSSMFFTVKNLDQPYTFLDDVKPFPGEYHFAVNIYRQEELITLDLFCFSQDKQETRRKQFNGAASVLENWIENTCLDNIWRNLKQPGTE